MEAACLHTTVSRDRYPYYAHIIGSCPSKQEDSGNIEYYSVIYDAVIISDRYLIAWHDSSSNAFVDDCTDHRLLLLFGVDRKSWKTGNITKGTQYEVDFVQNNHTWMFKTKKPIQFSSVVQPIPLIESGEGPKPGDLVSIIIPYYNVANDQWLVIPVDNVTVVNSDDCRKVVSGTNSTDVESKILKCSDSQSIWVIIPGQACSVSIGEGDALIVNNKLAGISDPSASYIMGSYAVQAFANLAKIEGLRNLLT
ncbi:hypothetical protein QAD02_023061 [Eretmocerus hayati]|uniref:Uncharacterized protein n=1 Tax=Eretmocerus hayati TaxID=131215 RepID=A0ACC2PY46_9HYME|nr:hypothetical protein QAD02_023061 [Eretmocerus hayati]